MGKGFSVAVYYDFLFSPLSSCRHFPHLQDALNARTKAVMLTGWLPEVGKGRWSRKCSEVRPNLATLWTTHTCHQVWKVQQRLYFLRKLKHAHLSHHLLTNFYRSAIESAAARCGSPAARHRTGRTCSGWWGQWGVSSGRHYPLSFILADSKRRPAVLLRTPLTPDITCSPPALCNPIKDRQTEEQFLLTGSEMQKQDILYTHMNLTFLYTYTMK